MINLPNLSNVSTVVSIFSESAPKQTATGVHFQLYFPGQELGHTSVSISCNIHCKKKLAIFPSPAGMSLTKLSLARNNLIIPG